ncbi:MAG: triose-phosphate isomerase [Alphaproteobacteria bacterium]|nr:triose-phosphate isomerase [Alphaproteobacteria bacterium]
MRKLVAGNWKMNGLRVEGAALARDIAARAKAAPPVAEIVLCPPATLLVPVGEAIAGSGVALGAQDCHPEGKGAHTGDISAPMLKDAGCSYVIVGHSERRQDHNEGDAVVRAKAAAAVAAGLCAIVCVGETAAERDSGRTEAVVVRQLRGSLPPKLTAGQLVVAYEPVWAIGSGKTPTPHDVAAVHGRIRDALRELAAESAAVRILYGGSVKPANARALLSIADVDGALVGGASLVVADFWAIARGCG